MYVRLPTNEDGSQMSYTQRKAERQRQDAERRATQKNEPAARDPFYDLPESERRAIRRSEEQGRIAAQRLSAIESQAKRQAGIDGTPEHLRRPENIFTRLIAEWEGKSYRPDVAAKIKAYRKQEAQREKEIEIEMADKLRQYKVNNDPEVQRARAHLESARAGAEPQEQVELARLSGILSAGQSGAYWDSVAELMAARLRRIQEQVTPDESSDTQNDTQKEKEVTE
jgi:hypothetical protein